MTKAVASAYARHAADFVRAARVAKALQDDLQGATRRIEYVFEAFFCPKVEGVVLTELRAFFTGLSGPNWLRRETLEVAAVLVGMLLVRIELALMQVPREATVLGCYRWGMRAPLRRRRGEMARLEVRN